MMKQRFVDPILTGAKTDTVRGADFRAPAVGDLCVLAVGISRPFARVRVTHVERLQPGDLPMDRLDLARDLCGGYREYLRITFELDAVFRDHVTRNGDGTFVARASRVPAPCVA